MKRFMLCLVIFLGAASSTMALNSERKGFVFGIGVGYAPTERVGYRSSYVSRSGFAGHMLIGAAVDERNILAFDGNMAFAGEKSRAYPGEQMGFFGLGWYHYYGSTKSSFFTTLGAGLYYFKFQNRGANSLGLAYQLGAGFTFATHFQFGGYFARGNTESDFENYDYTRFDILLSLLAF